MDGSRRGLVLASLTGSLGTGLLGRAAEASPLNPAQTIMRPPNELQWIAICGMGPVNYKLVDPEKPGWRAV